MSDRNLGAVESLTSKAIKFPALPPQYHGPTMKGAATPTAPPVHAVVASPPPTGTGCSTGNVLRAEEIPAPCHAVTAERGYGPPQASKADVACLQTKRPGFGQSASHLPQRLS